MRHCLFLYSPSLVLLGWAAYLSIWGRNLTVAILGLVALAVTLGLHFHAERRQLS